MVADVVCVCCAAAWFAGCRVCVAGGSCNGSLRCDSGQRGGRRGGEGSSATVAGGPKGSTQSSRSRVNLHCRRLRLMPAWHLANCIHSSYEISSRLLPVGLGLHRSVTGEASGARESLIVMLPTFFCVCSWHGCLLGCRLWPPRRRSNSSRNRCVQ
jgi:hypothetical protein